MEPYTVSRETWLVRFRLLYDHVVDPSQRPGLSPRSWTHRNERGTTWLVDPARRPIGMRGEGGSDFDDALSSRFRKLQPHVFTIHVHARVIRLWIPRLRDTFMHHLLRPRLDMVSCAKCGKQCRLGSQIWTKHSNTSWTKHGSPPLSFPFQPWCCCSRLAYNTAFTASEEELRIGQISFEQHIAL